MSIHKTVILTIFALLPTLLFAQRDTVVPTSHRFVERGGRTLMLDIYTPSQPRPDSACVVYVFGGGFFAGSRDNWYSRTACQSLAAQGFVAVAIDYRLTLAKGVSPDSMRLRYASTIFGNAIETATADCAAAIAYLWDNADNLGIARNRIVLTGASAGAITVLQLDYLRANRTAHAEWTDAVRELPPDFKPAAVVPYAGAVFTHGGKPQYATPPAPTCFFHGTIDRIVNYNKMRASLHSCMYGPNKLAKVFKRNNYSYWIFRYTDHGHEINAVLPETMQEFTAFVDAALAGRVMQFDAQCHDTAIHTDEWTHKTVYDLYVH